MSKSPVMTHDDNNRQDFKEQTLRRVYDALNPVEKTTKAKNSSTTEVTIKGLQPKDIVTKGLQPKDIVTKGLQPKDIVTKGLQPKD